MLAVVLSLGACGDTGPRTSTPQTATTELHAAAAATLDEGWVHVEEIVDGESFSRADFDLVSGSHHKVVGGLLETVVVDGVTYSRRDGESRFTRVEMGASQIPTTMTLVEIASEVDDVSRADGWLQFALGDLAPFGFEPEQVVQMRVEGGHIVEIRLVGEDLPDVTTLLTNFGEATVISAPAAHLVDDQGSTPIISCPTDGSDPPEGTICIDAAE